MTLPHGIQDSTLNLEGSKSNYFILYWTFNDNGIPKLKAIDNTNNPVRLLLYDKPQEQLRSIRHDYDENHFKSLGTYISGSLNDDYEFHIAQSKIKTFTKFLLSCPLYPKETRIAYIQYLIPSLLYGAVVQTFSIESCERLHCSLLPTLLPKLGYPNSLPRPIVFGPIESGGLGLPDINAVLLSPKIQFILKHEHAYTDIGKLHSK